MSALKLYLLLIKKDEPVQLTVHRDLVTLESAWLNCNQSAAVGIVHIGFIRPKLKSPDRLLKHLGKMLVTPGVKWALPEGCHSSVAVIAELNFPNQTLPLYQLLEGLGCDELEPTTNFEMSKTTGSSSSELTIAEAAEQVLNKAARPLNKEEVFSRIIEAGLYQFGATKPVSVLAVELNRYSRDTEYSNAASEPLFQKVADDRYYSLSNQSAELSGWVKKLVDEHPGLARNAILYGVFSEESYIENAKNLPPLVRDNFDLHRFSYLYSQINSRDLQSIIKILPMSLLAAELGSIDLPVRIINVLNVRGFNSLSDLFGISTAEMLSWPNFGRKSVGDFCEGLAQAVNKLSEQIANAKDIVEVDETMTPVKDDVVINEEHQFQLVSAKPLKEHYQATLSRLKDKDRQIIEYRTGLNGQVMTLESVGALMGVTRERIRQIQKKYVEKIIETELWDDCIALKIGQLLIERRKPLYIEMLEVEDPWFSGFMGNYQHLAAIIELFSENEIRVIKINSATIVTRIKIDVWDQLVRDLRKSLKDKATEGTWSRQDIEMTLSSTLLDNSASELLSLLWGEFGDTLQFDGDTPDAKLIGFGKSAESAVAAVLSKAEKPLHYSEVAERASEIYGKEVSVRLAHNACPKLGGRLYGRGIYGLPHHNPISERMRKNIKLIVSQMIQEGPLMKQWHCAEVITKLKVQFSALPEELDHYILNIILEDVDNLTYLNRMVWARADSNQSRDDRVDMADAFTKILEDNGAPLKGKELKSRLREIRGVVEGLQIQPNERMIQVGPDFWGLIDRDVGGDEGSNEEKLVELYDCLKDRQRGVHVTEVSQFIEINDNSKELPSAYALLNLAQRDERFHLGRSMFLGLSEWGGDTRRLNTSQAVRKILDDMTVPMSLAELTMRVEDLTEMHIDSPLSNVLISEGAIYDQAVMKWKKGS